MCSMTFEYYSLRSMFHPVLFQLFEHVSRISSSIDFYTELIQDPEDQLEHLSKSFLLKTVTGLADQCRTTTNLFQANEQTFGHLGEYLMIKRKFTEFDSHCQVNVHLDFGGSEQKLLDFRDSVRKKTISRRLFNPKPHRRPVRFLNLSPI